MSEDQSLTFKQIKPVFTSAEHLPTHYVNVVNIRPGLEEFFLTLGTVTPPDIAPGQTLEDLDILNAHPLFSCAMTRSVMKQVLDVMTVLYENQTKQIEQLQASQERDKEHGDSTKQ